MRTWVRDPEPILRKWGMVVYTINIHTKWTSHKLFILKTKKWAWWKEAAEGSEQVYMGERWERKKQANMSWRDGRGREISWSMHYEEKQNWRNTRCEHSSRSPETLAMCRPLMWPRAMSGSMVLGRPRFALLSVAHTSTEGYENVWDLYMHRAALSWLHPQ